MSVRSPDSTDRILVRAVATIVLATVVGIVLIAGLTIAVDAGIWGQTDAGEFRSGDEVVSVLGQIASAGVGALAGYFTARTVYLRRGDEGIEIPPDEGAP